MSPKAPRYREQIQFVPMNVRQLEPLDRLHMSLRKSQDKNSIKRHHVSMINATPKKLKAPETQLGFTQNLGHGLIAKESAVEGPKIFIEEITAKKFQEERSRRLINSGISKLDQIISQSLAEHKENVNINSRQQ